MAMSASSAISRYKTKLSALGITFNHTESDNIMKAMYEAIIEEIIANATIATTSGAPNSEHTGNVTG